MATPYLVIEPLRRLLPKAHNILALDPLYIVGYFSSPTRLRQAARLFLQKKKNSRYDAWPVDLSLFLTMPFKAGLKPANAIPLSELIEHTGPGSIIQINPPAFMTALWAESDIEPAAAILRKLQKEQTAAKHDGHSFGMAVEQVNPT